MEGTIALAFSGIYIAFGNGVGNAISSSDLGIMVLLVGIALSAAFGIVLFKRYAHYDVESSTFIFSLANFAFFAMLFVSRGMPTSPSMMSNIVPLLYIGIVYNVVQVVMYYSALRMKKTTFVTNIYFLSPFLTFVFANLILGEAIKAYYIIIAVLVTAGILIQRLDKVGGSYTKAGRPSEGPTLFDVTGAFLNSKHKDISAAVENGDRVLALKLHKSYYDTVSRLMSSGDYDNIFMDSHSEIAEQSSLVRELVGARENDMVVIRAGDVDRSERFFVTLSEEVEDAGGGQTPDLPNEQS